MNGRAGLDLVLVGGGHTHVQVLRRWMMEPVTGVRLTVVLDRPEAVYSGMVPGLVAGDYAAHQLEIDVVPLARRAGARVVLARATAIDPVRRRIEVDERPPLAYDLASLDVGATVRGLELPGVRDHALPTRPIRGFVDRIDAGLETAAGRRGPVRIVIVGAGAAGIELAFVLRARILARGATPRVIVLSEEVDILPGAPRRVVARVRREAVRCEIAIRTGARVIGVERDTVILERDRLACDLVVWATGAAPLPFPSASPLPLDQRGFVRVRRTLQVVGHDDLFAVGDCASVEDAPWVRKAGVYAVREGPLLDANLRARVHATALRRYRPQRDFLSLLNLGERRALAAKWGVVAVGGWVWHWKDHIDRRFVARFRVLDADGHPAAAFPAPMSANSDMRCGGCAAKVGASALERALGRLPPPLSDPSVLVGLEHPDDAAALVLPHGDVVVATIDAFRAFADDPWLVGRVAAVNAVSDVFAKGGRPRHALALVTVSEEDPARAEETLYQVLAGVRAALDPLGVTLVGGHTTSGPELFVGLSVSGELASGTDMLRLDGAQPGDALVLTKPLGTGVVLAADAQGRAAGHWVEAAIASMLRPNADAARIGRAAGVHACTDVSGFGLGGHLTHLLRASRVSACVALETLPALDGARSLLAQGVRSSAHAQNASVRSELAVDPAVAGEPMLELLFDPQTSGGLLFALEASRAAAAVRELQDAGDRQASVIGVIEGARAEGLRVQVVAHR